MSTQSPPLITISSRENSPSPTFRERQRAACGQSTSSFQGSYYGQPSTTASTTSFHQRRSPPLAAQTVPGQVRRAISPLCLSTNRDRSPEPPQARPLLPSSQRSLLHQIADQVIPTIGFAQLNHGSCHWMPSEGLQADRPRTQCSLPKDPTFNRAHGGERPNLRKLGGGLAGMQRRDASSLDKDCEGTPPP
ncbi:hypothetical protein V8E53_012167 [Lactarius tabidus]